jgi:hypothetical protein
MEGRAARKVQECQTGEHDEDVKEAGIILGQIKTGDGSTADKLKLKGT